MQTSFQKLLNFLNRLDDATLGYTLEHASEDTIMVTVSAGAQRWEVEFYADGDIQIEIFYSAETELGFEGEEALERLFAELEEDEEAFDEEDLDEDDELDELDELDEDDFEEDDLFEDDEEDKSRH